MSVVMKAENRGCARVGSAALSPAGMTLRHYRTGTNVAILAGMKLLDLLLNALLILSATLFLAYVGYDFFDFGLFTTLPATVSDLFLGNRLLQYAAVGVFAVAAGAKIRADRSSMARKAERRS